MISNPNLFITQQIAGRHKKFLNCIFVYFEIINNWIELKLQNVSHNLNLKYFFSSAQDPSSESSVWGDCSKISISGEAGTLWNRIAPKLGSPPVHDSLQSTQIGQKISGSLHLKFFFHRSLTQGCCTSSRVYTGIAHYNLDKLDAHLTHSSTSKEQHNSMFI